MPSRNKARPPRNSAACVKTRMCKKTMQETEDEPSGRFVFIIHQGVKKSSTLVKALSSEAVDRAQVSGDAGVNVRRPYSEGMQGERVLGAR